MAEKKNSRALPQDTKVECEFFFSAILSFFLPPLTPYRSGILSIGWLPVYWLAAPWPVHWMVACSLVSSPFHSFSVGWAMKWLHDVVICSIFYTLYVSFSLFVVN